MYAHFFFFPRPLLVLPSLLSTLLHLCSKLTHLWSKVLATQAHRILRNGGRHVSKVTVAPSGGNSAELTRKVLDSHWLTTQLSTLAP